MLWGGIVDAQTLSVEQYRQKVLEYNQDIQKSQQAVNGALYSLKGIRTVSYTHLDVYKRQLSGYVVLVFFLLANGLFLWIIPGGYHIPASGLADMQAFFTLAPLLYLFLVPALCMRLFAEERRTGTLELLLTRPLTTWQIVGAKYLAGFLLVLFSILPTLVYPVSLWFLAQPVGHIDEMCIRDRYPIG